MSRERRLLRVGTALLVVAAAAVAPALSWGFEWDGWRSGQRLDEVIVRACERNLGICPEGDIPPSSGFDRQVATSEWGKHTQYRYRSSSFGQPCEVMLRFTPTSWQLYEVEVIWDVQGGITGGWKQAVRNLAAAVQQDLGQRYGEAETTKMDRSVWQSFRVWFLGGRASTFRGHAKDGSPDVIEFIYAINAFFGNPELVFRNEWLEEKGVEEVLEKRRVAKAM